MKNILLVLVALALSMTSFAQKEPAKKEMDHSNRMNHDQMDMPGPDGCMMMNGKMMMIRHGKMKPMKRSKKMGNGTRMMADGTCVKKDGTKIKMKEGDHMDMSGNLHRKNAMKEKNEHER